MLHALPPRRKSNSSADASSVLLYEQVLQFRRASGGQTQDRGAHQRVFIPCRPHWDGFPRSTKRVIQERISTARTEATRERRIHDTAREAAEGRPANQWRRPETMK